MNKKVNMLNPHISIISIKYLVKLDTSNLLELKKIKLNGLGLYFTKHQKLGWI